MDFQFLVEMAWKSALISAAALALAAMLRMRSAGERSALLGTAVALIVALPLITLLLPSLTVVTGTVHEAAAVPIGPDELASIATSAPATARGALDDPTPLVELLWAGGALMVLLRLAAGLWTLRRWTRAGSEVGCPEWRAAMVRAMERTGCRRSVRLLVSDTPSPLSWGSIEPVILVDRDTVRDPEEADSVLAHELAHVVRGDWLVLILARIAVALFWFNPLMWLLERRIVREAEEAADARALEHVEPARYAQTLLSCAQQHAAPRLPASGMADAGLGARVRAILERRLRSGAPDPRWIRASIAVAALIAAPIAALKPVVAVVRSEAPRAPAAPASAKAPAAVPAPAAPAAPHAPSAAPPAPAAPASPEALARLAALGIAPPPPSAPLAPLAPLGLAAFAPPAPPAPPARLRPLIDADEISRDVQEAIAEAMRDKDEALAEAAQAREEALREMRDSLRDGESEARVSASVRAQALRDAEQAMREARRVTPQALAAARRGMREGAGGMVEGARGMERGADRMDQEADRLRSSDYREQQIAKAAREGRTLTHQQLLDMIPRLHEGAKGMRRGAEAMRRSAEKMRG